MASRADFLAEVGALRDAVDLPVLVDPAVDLRVKRRLMAGIAVGSFLVVEEFLSARLEELSDYIARGGSQFLDMPTPARRLIFERSSKNYSSLFRRIGFSESDLLAAARDLARTFSSLDGGAMAYGRSTLGWPGSNLQPSDVAEILQILGCPDKCWDHLTAVLKRGLRLPAAVPVLGLLETLAGARHTSAHSSSQAMSVTELRTLPDATIRLGFAIDCLATALAVKVHGGMRSQIPTNTHTLVAFRIVEPVGTSYRLIRENAVRGRRFDTKADAWTEGVTVTEAKGEILLALDGSGEIETWRTSGCP